MKYIVVLSILLIGCAACTSSQPPEQGDSVRSPLEEVIKKLSEKYQISESLDKHRSFSIEFVEILDTELLLSGFLRIHDIYQTDSSYTVSIIARFMPEMFLNLQATENQVKKILTSVNSSFGFLSGVMVVKLHAIRKIERVTTGYSDGGDISLELESSNTFNGKGTMIEVVILND